MDSAENAHIVTEPVNEARCPKCGAVLDVTGLSAFTAVQCPSCEAEFHVPARFGSFLLLQMLGAGGMGGVYRARDEGLNREVAIKVMLKSLGDDPSFVETFQREAQAAAKLNHPNIAQIYTFGQEKGQPYIAMELVSGGSLDKMMTQGPMDPTAVVQIGEQIAQGLQEAAEAGLVHGDVKPENILFDQEKNAKLVDFGLAAMNAGPNNEVWGTPYYIAPEKVRRQKSDFRSDIYSLGATLYHAIAGVPPFEGEDATAVVKARFEGAPKPLGEIRKKIPQEVEALVKRMLEVEPQLRYPTYGSLLGDMRRYLAKAKPVKLATSSKKIIIKGKRLKSTTGMNSASEDLSGVLPPEMTPVEQIPEEPESEEDASRRGRRTLLLVVAGLLLLSGLVGGGIYGGLKMMAAKREKARVALNMAQQEKARVSIAKSISQARGLLEKLETFPPEALTVAQEAADAVVAVLGEEARAQMTVAEPEVARALAGEGVETAAPPVTADRERIDDDATNAVTVAEAGGTTQAVVTVTNAAADTAETPVGSPDVAPAAPVDAAAPRESDLHPMVAIVRGMFAEAYQVKAGLLLARHLIDEVAAQAKTAETLTAPEQTEALVALANTLVQRVSGLPYVKEISEMARKTAQLKKTLAGVKSGASELANVKRQEALERERRLKAEAEAEKKRQAREAQEQKMREEREKVAAAEAAVLDTVRALDFRAATTTLRDLRGTLETEAGATAATLAIDRINRIKEFHAYLIDKVKGFKSARGWSVDEADRKTLSVGGVKIPWADVYNKRPEIVAELINALVRSDEATRTMRLSEKTKLLTNAALCLNLFYREIASARELARQLATTAAQQFDVEADTIKQLLPDFFAE